MTIFSTLKLILPALIVTLSGCALHELAYGTGTVFVQYDASTRVCQIDVNYKGNHHQQRFIADIDQRLNWPLMLRAYGANSNVEYGGYSILGSCRAHPDLIIYGKSIHLEEIRLNISLPSLSLKVEKNEILNGMTPTELAKTGFSVKFSDRNKPGVTSLPHIFDDETTDYQGDMTLSGAVAGIKQNAGPWCSQFTQIQSGTLHVFPEEDFTSEHEDFAESLTPDRLRLKKWVFQGVVKGYNC